MALKSRLQNWIMVFVAVVVALAAAEGLLRLSLFGTSMQFAWQNPVYYARTLDELWIYRHMFSSTRRWAVSAGATDASAETQIEFYRRWATSLVPDAELGYVRKPDVKTPCHETTNLATRGVRNYDWTGPKLVFFGDSFVESAACSADTLPARMEKLTGIETLNFGVGGYGLDQIFLYFRRVLPNLDGEDKLVLVGLIQDDLERVLLKVRTSPKPYFTIADGRLVLHTDHIHPASLNDFYQRPPERLYLYEFLRSRLGTPYYRSMMQQTRNARQEAVHAVTRLLIAEMANLRRQGRFGLAFVIFPTPGAPFDPGVVALLRTQEIPVIDLQGCLSGQSDSEMYAELHPTSLGNDLLAQCLVRELAATKLLR